MARSRTRADEVLDDLVVDVRLEQGEADLAHGGVDVGLGDAAAAGQAGEGLAQAVTERVEHEGGGLPESVGRPDVVIDRLVRGFWRHRGGASVRPGRSGCLEPASTREERLDEGVGLERHEVLDPLPDANEEDGHTDASARWRRRCRPWTSSRAC